MSDGFGENIQIKSFEGSCFLYVPQTKKNQTFNSNVRVTKRWFMGVSDFVYNNHQTENMVMCDLKRRIIKCIVESN